MCRVNYLARAIADLEAVYSFIAEDSPRKANATVQGILRKIKILRTMPYAGHRRLEFGPDVRTLVATPFVVFYRLLEHERVIEILRVIDGRRDLGTVFFSPLVAA